MKYLKKDMVKQVIALANACPPTSDLSAEEIRRAVQNGGKGINANIDAFNGYIRNIGDAASAELVALMVLGRDQSTTPDRWNLLVADAKDVGLRDLLAAPKGRIGQWLRTGMERLIRASKHQQGNSGQFNVAKPQAGSGPVDVPKTASGEDQQRELLAGSYVLASFKSQYGEVDGLRQLGRFMVAAGHLRNKDQLALFGLKPQDFHGALEAVLKADS